MIDVDGTRSPVGAPGPYEIAFIGGGSARMVETVVVNLIRRNAVFVKSDGMLSPVAQACPTSDLDPLEREVLERLARSGRRLASLRSTVERSAPAQDLEERLSRRGWTYPTHERERCMVRDQRVFGFLAGAAGFLGVLCGSLDPGPVEWAPFLVASSLFARARWGMRIATPAGRRVRRSLVDRGPDDWPGVDSDTAAVALHGVCRLNDVALRVRLLTVPVEEQERKGSDGPWNWFGLLGDGDGDGCGCGCG